MSCEASRARCMTFLDYSSHTDRLQRQDCGDGPTFMLAQSDGSRSGSTSPPAALAPRIPAMRKNYLYPHPFSARPALSS